MTDITDRLRRAIVTAQNDDLSKVGTDKRRRHSERVDVMGAAADLIDAASYYIDRLERCARAQPIRDLDEARSAYQTHLKACTSLIGIDTESLKR